MSGGRAALGSRARRPDAAPAAAPLSPESEPEARAAAPPPEPEARPGAPVAAEAPAAVPTGAPPSPSLTPFPSRDALTIAWADHVVPRLKGMARALYLAGRFVAADDGAATFALPSAPQIAKCEQYRPEVEAALADYFGRPVPLRLVLDDGGGPRDPQDQRGSDAPPPTDDDIDPGELVDAPPSHAVSGLQRLTQAFPGAQLVEES